MNDRGKLRRVGSLWKPRPGSKSKGSGVVTVKGWQQRFFIMPNDRKRGEKDPDYTLLSGDEPEVDSYASSRAAKPEPQDEEADDEIPF